MEEGIKGVKEENKEKEKKKVAKLEELIDESSDNKLLEGLMEMFNQRKIDKISFWIYINEMEKLSEKKRKVFIARLNYIKTKRTPLPMISVLITILFSILNSFVLLQLLKINDLLINSWNISLSENELSTVKYVVIIISNIALLLLFAFSYIREQGKISKATYLLELFK